MSNSSETVVTGGVTPLFVKHDELKLSRSARLTVYDFCKTLSPTVSREDIEGAQRIGNLWRIYLNNNDARVKLYTEGMSFHGLAVQVYEQNPYRPINKNYDPLRKTTKITIQNLPLSVSNEEVDSMLKRLGCTKMETKLKYECERDEDGMLTNFKNGNRSLFVDRDELAENPLPRYTFCGNWRCRIYHYGQPKVVVKCFNCLKVGHTKRQCRNPRVCRVCEKEGHREGEELCESYAPNDAVVFQGSEDPLSNFYQCDMVWKANAVPTSEHCYVYDKSVSNGRLEIANDVLKAKDAREVKDLSKKIHTSARWEEKSEQVMREVLREKVKQVPEVKKVLLETGDKLIAEAVPNQFSWSCGLSKEATRNTDPAKWPGKNRLGELWMELRSEIREKEGKDDGFKTVSYVKRKHSEDTDIQESQRARPNGTTPNK